MIARPREYWIDSVKTIACVLVVTGHLLQSLTMSGILENTVMYNWFNQTIYIFHVALFFICSGYLYQLKTVNSNKTKWTDNVQKKAISLGVPYFVFSTITWCLKSVFAASVNNQVDSLFSTLFLKPLSPYWYLYCIFIIYCITITIHGSRQMIFLLAASLLMKGIAIQLSNNLNAIIYMVFSNEIWFVLGMCLQYLNIVPKIKNVTHNIGYIGIFVFLILSWLLREEINGWYSFGLCILICASIVVIEVTRNKSVLLVNCISQYFFPIFVMHTLIAAPIRILLLHFHIHVVAIHVLVGLMASFFGPIVIIKLMEKMRWPLFFVYPTKIDAVRKHLNW